MLAAPSCRSRDSQDPSSTTTDDARVASPNPDDLLDRIDQALARATAFVLAHQGEDGAFRSTTYAAFKDGYSLSPLVLTALLFVPRQNDHAALDHAYRKGVDFVATLITEDGHLREGIDGPRYPTYSIASAILVLNVPDNARHAQARQSLLRMLRERQITEDTGWSPDDPSYGGWGYFHDVPRKTEPPDPMRSANLSATLFAIGALRLSGTLPDDPALQKARAFVERCQRFTPPAHASGNAAHDDATTETTLLDDGGFFFSPAVPDSNKAGAATDAHGHPRYRSYGSMTADGLRALLQLGVPFADPRVQAAAAWLEQHYTPAHNPGDFPPEAEIRRESAYYYYVWSSAHALRHLGKPVLATSTGALPWPEALAAELLKRQRPDGAWANPYAEMREDDPLVATSFAMAGLAVARMVIRLEYQTHGIHRPPHQETR